MADAPTPPAPPTSTDAPTFVPNQFPVGDQPPVQVPGLVCLGSTVTYTDIDGGTGQGVVIAVVPDDPNREGGVSDAWLLEVKPDGADDSVMVATTEAKLVEGDAGSSQPSASTSIEKALVAALKKRLRAEFARATFERGEVIRGDRGLLAGSEPGPLSNLDRAESVSMIGGALLDAQSTAALETILSNGLASTDQVATLANLMETGDNGNPISAVRGSEPITVTMPLFTPLDTVMNSPESVEGMPRGADTFQMSNGTDFGTYPAYGIGSGLEAAQVTQVESVSAPAVLQVEVPPGHPSIGIEGSDWKEDDPFPQPLDNPYDSNGIVLHPDTVFTTTSASVDAKTGVAVVSVTASMPPGFGQNNEEG